MSDIILDVRNIEAGDRRALEHVLGIRLEEHQTIIISVLDIETQPPEKAASSASSGGLPPWCNVYDGLSDEEITEIEAAIIRTPGSRSFE